MSIDFKTVVPAAQAGDKAARDKLMGAFYAWSVTQARTIARDSEQAKDIAVSFWEWLFTEGGVLEYDPPKGTFYAWMESRLRYRALDAVKQQRPRIAYYSELPEADSVSPDDPTDRLSAMQDLKAIADKLRPAQQDVFWRLLEGATVEEIAEECGLSEKRARNLIGQVREAIRGQIGD